MSRYEGRVVDFAGEDQRAGKGDCLFIVLLKVEVVAVRALGLGLPVAIVRGDIRQGFPSSTVPCLLKAQIDAGVPPKDIVQLAAEARDRTGRVRSEAGASAYYNVEDGAEQGRRKSPPGYCAMAKQIADGARAIGPGVGLDTPPMLARAARLAGIQSGLATPPQERKAAEIAATLQKWKADESPGALLAATNALRAAPDAAPSGSAAGSSPKGPHGAGAHASCCAAQALACCSREASTRSSRVKGAMSGANHLFGKKGYSRAHM